MNTFAFLQQNFVRYLLPNLSNDPAKDCGHALTTSHLLKKGTFSRFSGWAMITDKVAIVQSDLAAKHPKLITGDPRTRYQAWYDGLENFNSPTCFIEFTQSTVNIGNVFLTHDLRVVKICGPVSSETFNYLDSATPESGKAHKILSKIKEKNAVRL